MKVKCDHKKYVVFTRWGRCTRCGVEVKQKEDEFDKVRRLLVRNMVLGNNEK